MNNELLLLMRKHTDTMIEQTKTKLKGTLEFKLKKQTFHLILQKTFLKKVTGYYQELLSQERIFFLT